MNHISVSDPATFRANIVKKLNKLVRKKVITKNIEKGVLITLLRRPRTVMWLENGIIHFS